MDYTADAMYGGTSSPQPVGMPAAGPMHPAGTPAPHARTTPRAKGPLGNPVFILVGMIAVAVLLVQLSVRGSVSLKA
jgi:hypothetical protein